MSLADHSLTKSGSGVLVAADARSLNFVAYLCVAGIFAELVLASLVVRQADLFTPAFRRVFYLAGVGFLVHHLLPMRYRMQGFALLCAAALLVVMGGSSRSAWEGRLALQRGLPILAIGGIVAAIAVARIAFWQRVALLGGAGVIVAMFRAGLIGSPQLMVIWPVLAGFLMFRLIVYVYEVSTMKERPGLPESCAYFFLFPNSAVGLFPVVDFKVFARSHYDGDALTIYQRGMHWIVRGISHLIVYRLVQQLFALPANAVESGTDVIQFILSNSFLYLKVSGQFHVFVGLLLLFGFNLPETHRRYFLASSFTDYWRRVNIYWKDFILKVFYYPMYFRLKDRGATLALIAATLWSFFVTWALHLYQTWWLKGSIAMTWPDGLFWLILALLVLGNSLWELRRGRRRTLGSASHGIRSGLGLAVRTAATFACVSVLWSLWSTSSLSQWMGLWRFADHHTVVWAAVALLAIMLATLVFEVRPSLVRVSATGVERGPASFAALGRAFAQSAVPLLVICAVYAPPVQAKFDAVALQPWRDAINTGDSMMDERVVRNGGYYESLMKADPADAQLWETLMRRRLPHVYQGADPIRPVNDFRFRELIPNAHLPAYDTDFQTNRWGMRDRDYDQTKPAGTFRIAVLGSSHTMGWGVRQDEVFESIVERRLNTEHPEGPDHVRFEILNFAVNGLSPLGEISVMENQVAAFNPDLVLLVTHLIDSVWVARDLPRSLRQGVPIRFEFLETVMREARVTARTNEALALKYLAAFEPALLDWSYRQIAKRIDDLGAVPVALFVPLPADLPMDFDRVARQTRSISESGLVLLDFAHLYDGRSVQESRLMEPWQHTNPTGHALIADALYARLISDPRIEFLNRARRVSRKRPIPFQGPTVRHMRNTTTIEHTVKFFILDEFLSGEDPEQLTPITPLISSGILDSLATLKLVAFLEQEFSIAIGAHEADSENLETIDRIAALVRSKR